MFQNAWNQGSGNQQGYGSGNMNRRQNSSGGAYMQQPVAQPTPGGVPMRGRWDGQYSDDKNPQLVQGQGNQFQQRDPNAPVSDYPNNMSPFHSWMQWQRQIDPQNRRQGGWGQAFFQQPQFTNPQFPVGPGPQMDPMRGIMSGMLNQNPMMQSQQQMGY